MATKGYQLVADLILSANKQSVKNTYAQIKKGLAGVGVIDARVKVDRTTNAQLATLKRRLAEVQAEANRSATTFNKLGTTGRTANQKIISSSRQAKTALNSMGRATYLAHRRLLAYAGGGLSVVTMFHKLKAGAKEYMRYQSQLTRLAQLSGTSIFAANNQEFSNRVRTAAKNLGVSSHDILKAAVDLSQSGIALKSIDVGLLAKLSLNKQIDDLSSLSDMYIVLAKSMGQGSKQIERSLAQTIAISKQHATSVQDNIEIVKRAGSTASLFGIKYAGLLSAATVAQESTRLGGEKVGTGLKTIMTRIYAQQQTINALRKAGVDPFEGGKQKAFVKILNELSDALQDVSKEEQNRLLAQVAGVRQIPIIAAMMTNITAVNKTYAEAMNATNQITKDAQIAQSQLSVKLQRVKENWYGAFEGVADHGAIKATTGAVLDLTGSLYKLAPALALVAAQQGIGLLGGVGGRGTGSNRRLGFGKTPGMMAMGGRLLAGRGRAFAGMGGVAALYGSTQINPQGMGGATAQASLQGVAVGLSALALGITPVVAGLAGLATATYKLTDSFLNLRYRQQVERFGKGQGILDRRLSQQGPTDKLTKQALTNQLQRLKTAYEQQFTLNYDKEYAVESATSLFRLKDPRRTGDRIRKKRRNTFLEMGKEFEPTILEYAQQFASSGKTLKEWDSTMRALATSYDAIDDGLLNNSRSLKDYTKTLIDERAKLLGQSPEQLSKERQAEILNARKDVISQYEQLKARTSQEYATAINRQSDQHMRLAGGNLRLDELRVLAESTAFSFGKGGRPSADISNTMTTAYAKNLAGTSSITAIKAQLEGFRTALKSGTTNAAHYNAKINENVQALTALSDATRRTASLFDRLSGINASISSRQGLAEQMLMADPKQKRKIKAQINAFNTARESGFGGLTEKQKQEAIRGANLLGQARFGNTTAQQLKGKWLQTLNPQMFERDRQEQKSIQQQIMRIQKDAIKAQTATVEHEKGMLSQYQKMTDSIGEFTKRLEKLNIPDKIEMRTSGNMNVHVVGVDGLQQQMKSLVESMIRAEFDKHIDPITGATH